MACGCRERARRTLDAVDARTAHPLVRRVVNTEPLRQHFEATARGETIPEMVRRIRAKRAAQ
jgi:hypothetical protein